MLAKFDNTHCKLQFYIQLLRFHFMENVIKVSGTVFPFISWVKIVYQGAVSR